MGSDVGDLQLELLGCTPDGGTVDRTAAAPAGAEGVRGLAGVALVHLDVVERYAEVLADELRGGGLQPLAVLSGAEIHRDAAVGLHADVRRFGAVRPHHALRLDVQADAEAEEPPGVALLALPRAEPVVVDHRRGLLERLRR